MIIYHNQNLPSGCSGTVCKGSILYPNVVSDLLRTPQEVFKHASDFICQYYAHVNELNSVGHELRMSQIKNQILEDGTYHLTYEELLFGAKTAWRNAARCIGRFNWNKIKLFDCRHVKSTAEMFEALCNHIKYSQNNGNIRCFFLKKPIVIE